MRLGLRSGTFEDAMACNSGSITRKFGCFDVASITSNFEFTGIPSTTSKFDCSDTSSHSAWSFASLVKEEEEDEYEDDDEEDDEENEEEDDEKDDEGEDDDEADNDEDDEDDEADNDEDDEDDEDDEERLCWGIFFSVTGVFLDARLLLVSLRLVSLVILCTFKVYRASPFLEASSIC